MLSVGQACCVMSNAFWSVPPHFSVGNIWPDDAPVFQVAASGNIQDMMKLLHNSEYTIRDHDTNGMSVLYVRDQSVTSCYK
jgi:hypothetical protein